jgi:hypothetical protein
MDEPTDQPGFFSIVQSRMRVSMPGTMDTVPFHRMRSVYIVKPEMCSSKVLKLKRYSPIPIYPRVFPRRPRI